MTVKQEPEVSSQPGSNANPCTFTKTEPGNIFQPWANASNTTQQSLHSGGVFGSPGGFPGVKSAGFPVEMQKVQHEYVTPKLEPADEFDDEDMTPYDDDYGENAIDGLAVTGFSSQLGAASDAGLVEIFNTTPEDEEALRMRAEEEEKSHHNMTSHAFMSQVLLHKSKVFISVADPGGAKGPWPPPVPVKTSHKKDPPVVCGALYFMFLAPLPPWQSWIRCCIYISKFNIV